MRSTFADRGFCRARRLGFGLLLLALPACGLSDYEALMRETQEREERFRNENKYLDEPVQIPTRKNPEGRDVAVAEAFFRPPKGIGAKPDAEPIDEHHMLWRYRARTKGADFASVEMAFNKDDKEFVTNVFSNYGDRVEEPRTPKRELALPFDTWEFDGTQYSYSINISKGERTQVAIVFVFGKGRRDALRTAIDLSLQSLAVDLKALPARQKYNRKSPWRLKPAP